MLQRLFLAIAGCLLCLGFLTTPPASAQTSFLPFFDEVDNPVSISVPKDQPVDMSPQPPVESEFDQAVLETCGEFGTQVQPETFKAMMQAHPEALQAIMDATDGEIRPGRSSETEFLDDLTNIWFKHRGFQHIFCGEDKTTKIGGLHFGPRYLQLQQEGIGGRLPNNEIREQSVPGVLYTLGVVVQRGDRILKDPMKGYAYVSDAQEMLTDGTKAFKVVSPGIEGTGKVACTYSVDDVNSETSYPATFVATRQGIITFYSVAIPRGSACSS